MKRPYMKRPYCISGKSKHCPFKRAHHWDMACAVDRRCLTRQAIYAFLRHNPGVADSMREHLDEYTQETQAAVRDVLARFALMQAGEAA